MYVLMCYQKALWIESFIIHFTGIRVLMAMYALMCYQTARLTE